LISGLSKKNELVDPSSVVTIVEEYYQRTLSTSANIVEDI